MASLFILGSNLIEKEDYQEKLVTGQIDQLMHAAETNKPVTIGFSNLEIHSADVKTIPFRPIGIGLPLSIEIMTLYTGDFISNRFLSAKKRDLLCSSGVKTAQTFDAASRAINLIQSKAPEHTYLEFGGLKAGTPYIFYTKAVDEESILVSIEMDSNSFNEETIHSIGNLIGKAAGLPIFMPAAPFLLAGSQLFKIFGEGGNNLFETSPFINETMPIRFATAGLPTNIARHILLCSEQDKAELGQLTIGYIDDGGIYKLRLMKDNKPYKGDAPYIIINIDGSEKNSLESFTPTLATSAMVKKFFGGDDKIADGSSMLFDAMSLYNDFTYRRKAEKVQKVLDQLKEQPDSEEFKRNEVLLKAYKKNIQSDLLKIG